MITTTTHLNVDLSLLKRKFYFVFIMTSFLLLAFQSKLRSQSNALHFNGTSDNVTLPYNAAMDFSITSKFTIEAWFKTSNFTAVLYSNHVDLSPFAGHEVAIVNNKLVFDVTNNYLTNAIRIETVNSYNDGNWHHFACVYKGIPSAANIDIYVDGSIQTVTATINNLTGSINTGNAPHLGCRNNTAYFLTGTLDELRVWSKALCAAEITVRKNCELVGNEPNLLAYYNFNQGVAGGSNPTVTTLPDISGNNITGTLTTFALTGTTSNWIASTASITGSCSYVGPITVSGNTLMCVGNPNVLTGNGATSYTWSTSSNSSSISVSPTVTTTYSVVGTNTTNGCYGTSTFTQAVSPCTGLQNKTALNNELLVFPNPGSGLFIIAGLENGATIEVHNILGEVIYNTQAESDKVQLDLLEQKNGIYFIKCSVNGQTYSHKIIKE